MYSQYIMKAASTIDDYINEFPPDVQKLLRTLRDTIHKAAPKAVEAMKYGLPTFVWNGNLVHFGGFKSHIGFYPAPSGIRAFEKQLARYEKSKGAIRFPMDEPLPLSLIARIVKFRVKENNDNMKDKKM